MVTNKLYSKQDIDIIKDNMGDVLDEVKKIKAKETQNEIIIFILVGIRFCKNRFCIKR